MLFAATPIVLCATMPPPTIDSGPSKPDCAATHSCESLTLAMPGIFATTFVPAGPGVAYSGPGVELALLWASDDRDGGPGRGSVYAATAILRAPGDAHALGLFEAGMTLSFEMAPRREILVPFWGFSFGSVAHSELPGGGYFQGRLGLHLLFVKNVVADLGAGYHYPFQDIDTMRGPRAQLTLRSALW